LSDDDHPRGNRGWFRKGQSGNPGGRPKGTGEPSRSPFDDIIERTIQVTRQGVQRELTVDEALQQRTLLDALAGKKPAIKEVMRWIIKREQWLAKHRQRSPSVVAQKIREDPENADDALLLLDIACIDPVRDAYRRPGERRRLLLEPWAVNVALRRRSGPRKLTKDDCDNIRRSTRMDGTVKLPEKFDE
jgi:hypothetical protein